MADSELEPLLAVLDLDPAVAEQKCKALWQRMVFYFRKNGISSPEDLVQEAFTRANSRIAEGQQVYAAQPESYFFGIARNVLLEERKRAAKQPVSLTEETEDRFGSCEEMERTERQVLLESCLQKLEEDERAFLELYMREGAARTALILGISSNAASIRFHRLTIKLQSLTQQSRRTQ